MERGISLAIEKFGPAWLHKYHPDTHTQKTLNHIHDCRTEIMGGRIMVCPECGTEHIMWNSCRDRHCPNCQSAPREAWLLSRKEELLPVTYFHVVFTVPECLNATFLKSKSQCYSALFSAAWETIKAFASKREIQMGMTAMLHTWGSNLSFHPHIHCIVPGGGMRLDSKRWMTLPQVKNGKGTSPFLFPVKALSDKFRTVFIKHLTEEISIESGIREQCFMTPWVVYAKSPVCGVDKTLEYIARYAYRVAISNNRIKDVTDNDVVFAYKDYADNENVNKMMMLEGTEFVRRYALHILPERFVRIRHFGIFAPGNRAKLAKLQRELGIVPVIVHRVRKTWQQICQVKGYVFGLCCECKVGILQLIERIPRARSPEYVLAYETR